MKTQERRYKNEDTRMKMQERRCKKPTKNTGETIITT